MDNPSCMMAYFSMNPNVTIGLCKIIAVVFEGHLKGAVYSENKESTLCSSNVYKAIWLWDKR